AEVVLSWRRSRHRAENETEFVVIRGSGHVVRRRSWWLRFQLMAEEENRDRERGRGRGGAVLKGITDDERKLLDEFEDVEYDRKAVEVVLTVNNVYKWDVGTYVWR
ncbi:unnamed protein product, partial [Brassica oleracea]